MVRILSTCRYCGEEIVRDFKTIRDATLNSRISVFCNAGCEENYKELKREKSRLHPEYSIPRKQIKKIQPKRKIKFDPTMDMCAVCRIPNNKCERILSDFTILPEGARVNDNGKICECPNFKL